MIFFKNGKRELYNLKEDLGETRDVLAANPDVVERLAKLMQQYIDNGRSTPGAAQKNGVSFALPKPVAAPAGGEGGEGTGRKRKKAK